MNKLEIKKIIYMSYINISLLLDKDPSTLQKKNTWLQTLSKEWYKNIRSPLSFYAEYSLLS